MKPKKAIILLGCFSLFVSLSFSLILSNEVIREKEGYINAVGVIYNYYQEGGMSTDAFYVQFKDDDRVYFFPRDEISETLIKHPSGSLIRIFYTQSWINPVLHLEEIRKIYEVKIV